MAAQLVTLAEAKSHLRILNADDELGDLEAKVAQAEEIVLGFVERIDTGWTASTVPLQIKAAILMVAAHLWEHRGEEDQGEALSPNVRSVLRMVRDPALA